MPIERYASIGIVEVESLAASYRVLNDMVNGARFNVLSTKKEMGADLISLIIGGEVSDITEAVAIGMRTGSQISRIEHAHVISRPSEEVYRYIFDLYKQGPHVSITDAVGIIETRGFCAALALIDVLVKSAAVGVVGVERTKSKTNTLLVAVKVHGSVSAVEHSLSQGRWFLESNGMEFLGSECIPRPDISIADMVTLTNLKSD